MTDTAPELDDALDATEEDPTDGEWVEAASEEGLGYVHDVIWPGGFVAAQQPMLMRLGAILSNRAVPALDRPFRYCDVGCSTGTTVLTLASAFPDAEFVGIDINPDHIEVAREAAETAGLTNLTLIHGDVATIDDSELGEFDFVTCYGVFSWVHPSVQAAILAFAGAHLRPDGLFLVEYASRPASVQQDPLWQLMRTTTADLEVDSAERVRQGFKQIDRLNLYKAQYLTQNPQIPGILKTYRTRDAAQTAHAVLSDWKSLYHSEVADQARRHGLSFSGRVPLGWNIRRLWLRPEWAKIAESYNDHITRETVIDYLTHDGDRIEVYSRLPIDGDAAIEQIDQTAIVRGLEATMVPRRWRPPSGQTVDLGHPVHKAIIEATWDNSVTIGELVAELAIGDHSATTIRTAACISLAANITAPARNPVREVKEIASLDRLRTTSRRTELALEKPFDLRGRGEIVPAMTSGHITVLVPLVRLHLDELINRGSAGLDERMVARIRESGVRKAPKGHGTLEDFVAKQNKTIQSRRLPRLISHGVLAET